MPPDINRPLTRREVLGLIGAAGAAVIAACGDGDGNGGASGTPSPPAGATALDTATTEATAVSSPSALSCVVSPEQTEGPYFVDEMLNRADIRSDPSSGDEPEGVPLRLAITVSEVDGDSCAPIAGAHVDVWHCDAEGLYSDVAANNTVGQQFLRGYQLTDANGAVEFTTIYPGWYMGRTVHIHVKVRTDPESNQGYEFTSQLYFDEDVNSQVYSQAPYSTRGTQDTNNASDGIFQGGGDQMLLRLTPEGDGYLGAIDIGLDMG